MAEKRRGLGRGISALIPQSAPAQNTDAAPTKKSAERPRDVYFREEESVASTEATATSLGAGLSADSGKSATGKAASAKRSGAPASGKASATGRRAASSTEPAASTTEPEAPEQSTSPADGDGLVPVPGAEFAELKVTDISPNARQPRQVFDEDDLEELTASIAEVGVLQPIVVRPRPQSEVDAGETRYELVMGERRWRSTQRAGLDVVPAIIRTTTDDDLLRDALLENLHRAQLNPLEEASAYQQLLEDFDCTHEELARRIARSRPQISNTLRLLKLPPLVQRRVAAGVLSAGHARALLGLADGAAMERLAQRIVAEGLSVRSTEEIVALGDEPAEPEMRRRKREQPQSEGLTRLSNRLADRFDTRVKVTMGQRKGRITIEFAGADDLERILESLAPGDSGLREPELGSATA